MAVPSVSDRADVAGVSVHREAPHERHTWPGQPLEFWQAIGRDFGVSEILVPGNVQLRLPRPGGDEHLSVDTIPPR